MRKSLHSEEKITSILKEHEAGAQIADLCRRHGMSQPTFYNWKSKSGGLDASDVKRLKALEAEHQKLKKLHAEQVMDVVPKARRRDAVSRAIKETSYSRRRACALIGMSWNA
jgi:putative transposase